MVLKTEQVRLLDNEENLIDDAGPYSGNSAVWATLHDYGNVTVAKRGILVFNFEVKGDTGNTADFRLKVGSLYCLAAHIAGQTYTEKSCICFVEAGTYNILLEYLTSSNGYVQNFKCGYALFSDMKGNTLQSYSATLNSTVLKRKTPIGKLKQTMLCVNVFAYTAGGQANFENDGDAPKTNGIYIEVNGVQQSWTERLQDAGSIEAAFASMYLPVDVDELQEVEITKRNGSTVVHISVVSCPWLLGSVDHEPVTIDFLQNSTVYVVCEPLDANPTKTVKVGKARAVSFGDATDYYDSDTDSGSEGILSYSYTFENVKIGYTSLLCTGLGACISNIGVDVF